MRSDYSEPDWESVDGGRGKKPCSVSRYWGGQSGVIRTAMLLVAVAASCLVVYRAAVPLPLVFRSGYLGFVEPEQRKPITELERVLMNASMENKTVIITALNQAWADPNSTFDVFVESFRMGQGTQRLLRHVVAACLDAKAYARCVETHPHCYLINPNGTDSDDLSHENSFMTPGYLKLIWTRMNFLRQVLDLGYSFIFTDADIVWLRDPFPRLFQNVDFQIASDSYFGNPYDKRNRVNSGFTYTKANNRTIKFYEFWCNASRRFPNRHDQDVFNMIKFDPYVAEIGIEMSFLDTVYFGGFCQPSRDINVVCTMHANCCKGLKNKVNDLKIVLEVWKRYASENATATETRWNIPAKCYYR